MNETATHRLFISYSHADAKWLKKLQTHLKGLAHYSEQSLDCWDDTRIRAGDQWRAQIETALSRATAAILLLSPDFFASTFIAQQELPHLLEKARTQGLRFYILVVRPCRFGRDPNLGIFQSIHNPVKPLADLRSTDRDRVFDKLMQELEALPQRQPLLATPLAIPSDGLRQVQSLTDSDHVYHPYAPALPPLFVGRQAEMQTLAQALDAGQSISLVGDWRIGKSSLLGTWAQQARQRGREVRQLSGEGPEGANVAALVQAITGHVAPADADLAADQLQTWAARQPLPPLVLLDEAAALLRQPAAGRFWSRVRGMLEQCLWILATREPISDTSPDSPLLNRLALLRLALLSPDAAEQLIYRYPWPATEPVELLRTWAGHHPFYLQLLGHHLQHNAPDWSVGLEHFIDEACQRLHDLWGTLNAVEQETLTIWIRGSGKEQIQRRLRQRGLFTGTNRPFGKVFVDWLEGMTP